MGVAAKVKRLLLLGFLEMAVPQHGDQGSNGHEGEFQGQCQDGDPN